VAAAEEQILFALGRLDDDKQPDADIEAALVAEFDIPGELAERRMVEAKRKQRAHNERQQDAQDAKVKPPPVAREMRVSALEDFAAVDEAGASALVGTDDNALIPEDGDVCIYGNGGAGKTTLTTDLAFHIAAADDWLGFPIPAAKSVLLIENEGPRPFFRAKLNRKRDAWEGSPVAGRVSVLEDPWGAFTFEDEGWRKTLAAAVTEGEIDVIVAGPVTRLGMNEAGTLQHVRDFLANVADVRKLCGRALTIILVHHMNKAGTVSGAWEGSGDTLIQLETHTHGSSVMTIEKARWAPDNHATALKLAWAPGEGYVVKDERDYVADITRQLDKGPQTAEQIRMPRTAKVPGIGASRKKVEAELKTMSSVRSRDGIEANGESEKGVYHELIVGI
jgi:hypothetical protein